MLHDEIRSKWPVAAAVALVCVAGIGFVSMARQRQQTRELAAANQTLNASLAQMQNDLRTVTEKLNDVLAAKSAPVAAPSSVDRTAVEQAPAPRTKAKARTAQIRGSIVKKEDPRWNKIQSQIADQQKLIESTREDLGKTRDDLAGRLDATRGDLSNSIARNHEELVILEKRGERSYAEFKLDKSKEFQRIGAVRLSLRKADLKHKSFDLAMMVDDNELQKKKVNLYEPVWINLAGEQLELVVNQIGKDHVQGYVSAPKYKKSELAGIQ